VPSGFDLYLPNVVGAKEWLKGAMVRVRLFE